MNIGQPCVHVSFVEENFQMVTTMVLTKTEAPVPENANL